MREGLQFQGLTGLAPRLKCGHLRAMPYLCLGYRQFPHHSQIGRNKVPVPYASPKPVSDVQWTIEKRAVMEISLDKARAGEPWGSVFGEIVEKPW